VTIKHVGAKRTGDSGERRRKKRFAIEQDVRYRILNGHQVAELGLGRTINISSGGVFFTSARSLPIGLSVELSINWPVLLGGSCPLKLLIQGCVIRSSNDETVLAVAQYEFRTQGLHPFQSSRNAEAWEADMARTLPATP